MEPILSKLQEGVKYPRFERDATKTINDLVDHITKERGVYSSSIEPNPKEHSVWFNTNDNTLYIYDGNKWDTVSDKNISISKEQKIYPYPVINVYNKNESVNDLNIEKNKHYVIIINTNNIKSFLNLIVIDNNDKEFTILGSDVDTSGIFLVNIYNTYIYYIKLSSFDIIGDNFFYCDSGILYYYSVNGNHGRDGIYISGFYGTENIDYIIENNENKPIEEIEVINVLLEPKNDNTIIIGDDARKYNMCIVSEELEDANIYMYNNILCIGNEYDNIVDYDTMYLSAYIYCNCKQIGDIIITHDDSNLNLSIGAINFIVSNNNTLTIEQSVGEAIDELYVYVIPNSLDTDKSKVILPDSISGSLWEYVNLCGTPITGRSSNTIPCYTFITTTIDDIDKNNITDSCINFSKCNLLIIDAKYRTFNSIAVINYLKTCEYLQVYTTDNQVHTFLNNNGLTNTMVRDIIINEDDNVHIIYKKGNDEIVYENTIYKR